MMRNKTYFANGYYHTEMDVKTEDLHKVLTELESNEKVFGITIHYINVGKICIRFGSIK